MRYIVIKDVKSNPSKAAYTILPVGVKDAEEFAEMLVKAHEGSVKYCDSFVEVMDLLRPKAEAKDDIFAYAGPKTLKSFPILDPNADEASLRALFEEQPAPDAGRPGKTAVPPPSALAEVQNALRIVRGLVNDVATCRYGVSISTLAKQIIAELDYIDAQFVNSAEG